jgi:2,3-bisphosphoglycerate-independent phosphoglycerate mutase
MPKGVEYKYVIVIPDGCADDPQEALGGRTPLQAAHLPSMDRIARMGMVGRADNVPRPLTPASDVATLSLFGYDPLLVYTGRAPLETAAMGLTLGPGDWAVRCNLVTVQDGLMRDFTAGHISSEEARALMTALQGAADALMGEPQYAQGCLSGTRVAFHAGVQYRNILICHRSTGEPFSADTRTQPPHDIPDRPVAEHLPTGPGARFLIDWMEYSKGVLADHPVNQARRAAGKNPATQVWLWGQGRAPSLVPFQRVYGKRGAIISAVDLVRGVGVLLGWKRIDVAGATGYLDTDYAAKGRAGVLALADNDLVCVHVEAPDEASHEGRADEKVKALERIDEHIVRPLLEALAKYPAWRILVSPDHRTTLHTRAHAYGMVPFALAGTGISSRGQSSYDEKTAAESDLVFERGHDLMRTFLG